MVSYKNYLNYTTTKSLQKKSANAQTINAISATFHDCLACRNFF